MVSNGELLDGKASKEEMLSDDARASAENSESETKEQANKKRIWDQMEAHLQRSVEDWGGIESGIADTVVALNVLGVRTDESCEGHPVEWALEKGWPFVTLTGEDSDRARDLVEEFHQKESQKKPGFIKLSLKAGAVNPKYPQRYVIESQGVGKIHQPYISAAVWMISFNKWMQRITRTNQSYAQEMKEFTHFMKDKFYSDKYDSESVDYGKTLRGRFRLMNMDELANSQNLEIWDLEESEAMRFPLPENVASTAEGLKGSIPEDEIEKVGPFTTCASPESHIGPYKNSVDFLVQDGAPVLAMHDGTVVEIKDDSEKWGADPSFRNELNYVTIYYPYYAGYFSQYSHLKKGSVGLKIGDNVHAGQQIGEVGKSGWTDRDHLHVAIYKIDDRSENTFGFKSLKIKWDLEETEGS